MSDPNGKWSGISIELWREIAESLDMTFAFRETDLEGLISGPEAGELDVSVAALTMTSQREDAIDFTHPFYVSGLGIAVVERDGMTWLSFVRYFPFATFFRVLAGLAVILFLAGFAVWLFERRRNTEEFPRNWKGLAEGFWWSAVTMTTVGYGDRSPVTVGGRIIALIWMFASLFMIATFTGTVASTLTAAQLSTGVSGPEDLPRVTVATVQDSTSQQYLTGRNISPRYYPTVEQALDALAAGKVEAVTYDAPILKYQINQRSDETKLRVLPNRFEPQQYAIALKPGSELRELINRQILKITATQQWQDTIDQYLGQE